VLGSSADPLLRVRQHAGMNALRVVVLASGRGTTFAALLDAQRAGHLPITIRLLLSDRRTAPVLRIAEGAGIAVLALRPRDFPDRAGFDRALFTHVEQAEPDLIVLAGYMRIIDAGVVARWRGRMINLHPSLLPKYPGLDTHARALAAGDTTFGASVHFVTDELDGGPVIAQVETPVRSGDTAEQLAHRLRPLEHALLIETVRLIASRRIVLAADGTELDGKALMRPLRLRPDGTLATV
jgi:phosphoribosylglycinamide formyltransferase-1